jgi:hypothetical protein
VAWDADGNPDWNNSNNNLTAEYARLRNGSAGAYVANDQFLYDSSFLKLKTLQIGYTLPTMPSRTYLNFHLHRQRKTPA